MLTWGATGLRLAGASGRKPFRHCPLEAFPGFENLPRIGEWRLLPRRTDRLFDDRDNRFLKEFQQPHAWTITEQQPPRWRVVTMDNADRQFGRSEGQLPVSVIRADDQLLRTIYYCG
jgi:hypothetical protein